MSPTPRNWVREPRSMRYRGGRRRWEIRSAESADAKGEMRRSGRSDRPARVGVEEFTAWKR